MTFQEARSLMLGFPEPFRKQLASLPINSKLLDVYKATPISLFLVVEDMSTNEKLKALLNLIVSKPLY